MTTTDPLPPGIYHDLPYDAYRALPYLSQSVLKLMDTDDPSYGMTPLHAKSTFDGRLVRSDTSTLRLGRAEHCWIVEGEAVFRSRYTIAPAKCQATLKSGEPCGNAPNRCAGDRWYCGVKGHAPDGAVEPTDYLPADQVDRIRAMADAIHQHEACQFLKRPGWSEATIVYDVPVRVSLQQCRECKGLECLTRRDDGFRCRICGRQTEAPAVVTETKVLRHKARLDRLAGPIGNKPPLVLDLKRMQVGKGSRRDRQKVIANYGWHIQAAAYTEAAEMHFQCPSADFAWLFIEENEPHDVAWIQASEDVLRIGRDKLLRCREEWAKCLTLYGDDKRWPGYCRGPQKKGGLNDPYIKDYMKRHADDAGQLRSDALVPAT